MVPVRSFLTTFSHTAGSSPSLSIVVGSIVNPAVFNLALWHPTQYWFRRALERTVSMDCSVAGCWKALAGAAGALPIPAIRMNAVKILVIRRPCTIRTPAGATAVLAEQPTTRDSGHL